MPGKPRKDSKLCSEIRGYVETWQDNFKENIKEYHWWFNFVMGNQWDDDEEDLLRSYQKYPMVVNKLSPLAKHLLGEQRMNTPNLQVVPDDDIDVETVNVRTALTKDIMFNSDAKVVYQTGFQQSVIGGFGALGNGTRYINDNSFDQEIYQFAFKDATHCFWDSSAESIAKEDGMHAGFYIRMSREKIRAKYGKKVESHISDEMFGRLNTKFVWSNEEEVTVVECQKRIIHHDTLYELSDESTMLEDEFNEIERQMAADPATGEEVEILIKDGQMVTIKRQRSVERSTIKWYKIAGDYVLEETELPFPDLSILFIDQNSYYDKNGKQICVPFFKDARDAQKYLNYLATQSAYVLKVARYDQYMASKANIKSPETKAIWKNPSRYQGALIYDADKEGGTKPERLMPPELPQSLTIQYERTLNDIESCTGMYGARMGAQGNENSGAAIDARTRNGAYGNYVVFDSLNRVIAIAGKQINHAITKLYDTKRKMRLEMPDVGMKAVTLNNPLDEYGAKVENDMTTGEYKIRLLPGPSQEGQQLEAIQSMEAIIKADPALFKLFADLFVDNLTCSNKIELRNRLRTIVPPDVIEAGKTGEPIKKKEGMPPEMMMAIQKMKQAEEDIAIKEQRLELDKQKMGMEYELEKEKLKTQRLEVAGKLREQILRYQAETHRTQVDENVSHANNLAKILTHLPDPHAVKNKTE